MSEFPRSPRVQKVMQLANQEAQRFNHEYVGPEHLLLGLAKEGDGIAAKILLSFEVGLRKIRLEVGKLVRSAPDMVTPGQLPLIPQSKLVMAFAEEEARALKRTHVETEHVLLGLLRKDDTVAVQVFLNLGLKIEELRNAIREATGAAKKVILIQELIDRRRKLDLEIAVFERESNERQQSLLEKAQKLWEDCYHPAEYIRITSPDIFGRLKQVCTICGRSAH